MALNMHDPAGIMSIYSSIVDNENNWLLLHYHDVSCNELALHSYGSEGLQEMKTRIQNLNEVFIAFYREEVDVASGFIIITYVPPKVSGVKRARALVHSRRMGNIFKKHQTILTFDSLSLLTDDYIHQAILNPDAVSPSLLVHKTSLSADTINERYQEQEPTTFSKQSLKEAEFHWPLQPLRAKPTTNVTIVQYPPYFPPSPIVKLGGGSMFSNVLRRKKIMPDDLPPVPPPKDIAPFPIQPFAMPPMHSMLRTQRSRSLSDFAVVSHEHSSEGPSVTRTRKPLESHTITPTVPLRGKWSQDLAMPNDPVDRARRRQELQIQREKEEHDALMEEAERQNRIKVEKEEILRQEEEEEKKRKEEVQRDIRKITAERRRREEMVREEEEQRKLELMNKKKMDRERRQEEHRRLEEWRQEQAKKEEIATRRATEARKREEAQRNKRIHMAEAKVKEIGQSTSELTGWITLLNKGSISWKRRFYKFVGNTMFLYRNPKDTTITDKVELRGKIRGLKEWNQGYDDLEAIAFSFVIEFKDGDYWSLYADSEEEKYLMLGLLTMSSGL